MQRRNFWFLIAGLTSVWWFAGSTRPTIRKRTQTSDRSSLRSWGMPVRFTLWRSRRTASRC